ncbi:S49 family peptidase [Fimbriiglobus ruber]|uniref:Peptidase S49 n=1 Tax=Fimbriiglobus ruber TaxID=1908690 RepID=A0A225DCU8_9BACT|nr:S49 family peptidase [Fimbriiglobus ruber]OWK34959.1 Peptidase S49 [Fimbriiglobus ruber]
MSRDFRHVLASFYGTPWAIHPPKLKEIERALWVRIGTGHDVTPQAWDDAKPRADVGMIDGEDGGFIRYDDDIALVPIQGTITQRPSVFSAFSGGTSAEEICRAMDQAAADRTIRCIVLDVDSPGGTVLGLPEAASRVAAAAKQKPIFAIANAFAASAAYWLASQATELYCTPSGMVGSIGVISAHVDESRAEEMAGIKTTLITSGKFKGETDASQALTEDARANQQAISDQYYTMFQNAVATGRRVTASKVEADFGQGRMKTAADALASGMIDGILTRDELLAKVRRQVPAGASPAALDRGRRERAAIMAQKFLPTH